VRLPCRVQGLTKFALRTSFRRSASHEAHGKTKRSIAMFSVRCTFAAYAIVIGAAGQGAT